MYGSICGCYGCGRPGCCNLCCAGFDLILLSTPFLCCAGIVVSIVIGVKMLNAGKWLMFYCQICVLCIITHYLFIIQEFKYLKNKLLILSQKQLIISSILHKYGIKNIHYDMNTYKWVNQHGVAKSPVSLTLLAHIVKY